MQFPGAVIGTEDPDIFDNDLCSRPAPVDIAFTGSIPGRPGIMIVNELIKPFSGETDIERQYLELGLIKKILKDSTNTRLNFKFVCFNGVVTGCDGLGKNGVCY